MLTQRCLVSFCKIDIGLGSWLLAIFVTCWARVRNYHIRVYLKIILLKSPEIVCSHEVTVFSFFDTKMSSKDKDPELL